MRVIILFLNSSISYFDANSWAKIIPYIFDTSIEFVFVSKLSLSINGCNKEFLLNSIVFV